MTGLQNSTAILGRTEDGSERVEASGRDWRSVVVLRVPGVVDGPGDLVVVVVVVVVGLEIVLVVTVMGRVVVRVVVVSIKTFPEEEDSGIRKHIVRFKSEKYTLEIRFSVITVIIRKKYLTGKTLI